ncbi:MAG: marine proteobacterial sortase target protein [Pseudomonadota bacterium]
MKIALSPRITSKLGVLPGLLLLLSIMNPLLANVPNENTTAELQFESESGSRSSALLLNTHYNGKVDGLVATFTLTQTFRNQSDEWVNGRYVFPLPESAAVDSLILKTDNRILRGAVKEKLQAKREFQAAKQAGKKAGLLEQSRPNLFSMSLANIAPQAEVEAELTWVETVRFDSGRFSLRLPTTLTPRYIPGRPLKPTVLDALGETEMEVEEIVIDPNSGWSGNTDAVPDAADITPFQTRQTEQQSSHRFSFELSLNAGFALDNISSTTHGIDIRQPDSQGHVYGITLSGGNSLLDRDLLLDWAPSPSIKPDAALFSQEIEGKHYSLVMVMPPVRNIVQSLPREVIIVIDSSGSMAGVSMKQAKTGLTIALDTLSPADRFNVIDFDSSAHALFGDPQPASRENIHRARHFVQQLGANGGTNMEAALNLAFDQQAVENYLRQIVFITDGSVGNESALFSLIRRRLGNARLFTMGIGSAPNTHFMRGAAHYGRGTFSYIESVHEAASNMNALFARINRPVMQDIQIRWNPNQSIEVFPERIPDLYVGEPLMMLAQSDAPVAKVDVSGKLVGKSWSRTLATSPKSEIHSKADNLDKIWAQRKIAHLESKRVIHGHHSDRFKNDIINLGVTHQLVTRFTSFLAVEEKPSRPTGLDVVDKNVSNLMPAGNTMVVPTPNTATPATLQLMIGMLMLLLAGFGWNIPWSIKWKRQSQYTSAVSEVAP